MGIRYIAVASEAAYGEAWGGGPTQYMDVISESVVPDHGMLDIQTAGYKERRLRVPGPYSLGGDIELVGNVDDLGTALDFTLGTRSGGIGASVYRWYLTPSQTIPDFKMKIAPAVVDTTLANYASRRCVGGMSTAISLEAIAREALTATWSVAFQQDAMAVSSVVPPAAPGFSTVRPLIFYEGAVQFGTHDAWEEDPVANVEAFRCTIENDIDVDATVLGNRFLPGIRTQGITVSGDMDISFEDWDMYRWFYAGTQAGSAPTTTIAANSLVLTMLGVGTGDATAGFQNYKLMIECPSVYLDVSEANFDRRERTVEGITWNAVFNPTETFGAVTGYIVGAEVVNGINLAAI